MSAPAGSAEKLRRAYWCDYPLRCRSCRRTTSRTGCRRRFAGRSPTCTRSWSNPSRSVSTPTHPQALRTQPGSCRSLIPRRRIGKGRCPPASPRRGADAPPGPATPQDQPARAAQDTWIGEHYLTGARGERARRELPPAPYGRYFLRTYARYLGIEVASALRAGRSCIHGGAVEKFIGDAIMAFFSAPLAHGSRPSRPQALVTKTLANST